jgi:hypothetical protein
MWKHAVASPISEAHTLLAEPKRRNIKKAVANLNAVLKVVTDLYLANSQREPALASELLNFSSDVGNTISFLEPHVGVKMDIEEIRGLLDPNAPAMFTNLSLGDKL